MGTFSELPQIWAAAWIDVGDDLRQACRQILRVSDPLRRGQLLDELADIPVSRADVSHEIDQGKIVAADRSQDPDVWKARQRLKWARRFAEHYHQVAEKAAGE